MHPFYPAILILIEKTRNLESLDYNKQIPQFKTSLKIRKMNLVNNQADHEPTVSQQFEHGTQGPVVQRLDNAIHRINHYPLVKC